jgi:phosphohistidine phosphatase
MKTLYLLRHGQAPRLPTTADDFQRALDETGERQAAAVGLRLAAAEARPELIISSPAERTRQTAGIVAKALSYPEKQIRYAREIYAADVWLLTNLAKENPTSLNSLLLVGHNPVLGDFGEWLTGEPIDFLPTCGLLAITFDMADWSKIGRGKGRLLWRAGGR